MYPKFPACNPMVIRLFAKRSHGEEGRGDQESSLRNLASDIGFVYLLDFITLRNRPPIEIATTENPKRLNTPSQHVICHKQRGLTRQTWQGFDNSPSLGTLNSVLIWHHNMNLTLNPSWSKENPGSVQQAEHIRQCWSLPAGTRIYPYYLSLDLALQSVKLQSTKWQVWFDFGIILRRWAPDLKGVQRRDFLIRLTFWTTCLRYDFAGFVCYVYLFFLLPKSDLFLIDYHVIAYFRFDVQRVLINKM